MSRPTTADPTNTVKPVGVTSIAELPALVDVSQSDPRSFLGSIPQPPVRTKVSAGVRLPPLSTSFLCIL